METTGIRPDMVMTGAQRQPHGECFFVDLFLKHPDDTADDGMSVDGFKVQRHFAVLDAGQIQQIIHESRLGFDIAANHADLFAEERGKRFIPWPSSGRRALYRLPRVIWMSPVPTVDRRPGSCLC